MKTAQQVNLPQTGQLEIPGGASGEQPLRVYRVTEKSRGRPAIWQGGLPDSEIEVMVRMASEENPVAVGYHDGERWCFNNGQIIPYPVIGWMDLERAAAVLDANEKLSEVEVAE